MDNEELRLAVYHWFADTGRAPLTTELAEQLGVSASTVAEGLADLHRALHIVLDVDSRIVMAHPFSAIPLGFSVMGARTLWHGGGAWNSFALPHLLSDEGEMLVATTCPACGRAHAWNVGTSQPPEGDQVAHFVEPAARMWDDIVRACRHQRVFCSEECIDRWRRAADVRGGYVMDLATLWRFAAHWYDGRMERGYTRRDPPAAYEYFRNVGLSGSFWGL